MKFGKLTDISNVDFGLPEDDPSNISILNTSDRNSNFYIGATAWTSKEWKEKLYPPKTSPSDYLNHYGKHFNTIELNSTFYTLPNIKIIEKWKQQVPEDFRFCPKVWRQISHSKDLSLNSDKLQIFIERISHFGDKLGPAFIQLPPYFTIDNISTLYQFINQWPKDIKLAVEFRHTSIFEYSTFKQIANFFRKSNIIFLITDVAGRRDIIHSSLTSDIAMIRWVGNGLHHTDYNRCDEWIIRINKWVSNGIQDVYFFPHQPNNILTPEISQYIINGFISNKFLNSRGPRLIDPNKQLSLL